MTKWIIVILALVGIDQASKIWVSSVLSLGESVPVIPNFFHITYTRNTGILFGGLQGTAADYFYIFLIFAVLATAVFGYMFYKSDFKDKRLFVLRLSLTLLIAGSLGNAIDRAVQIDHAVIDFIDFNGIWSYIFNFADTFLNVGIFLFFVDTFFLEKKRAVANG
ncbi:MAG: signal peptidase II [Candidatus Izemoplasmatales bacterium]|nr:signal peptidase II [Candidatus Izemoplasmatales bacterium]